MGKTGTMHAWEQESISGPDIQTIGKALGGGFVPLSAVLLNQRIFKALAEGTGTLAHGHTFQAHPTACAAAVEVQKIIQRDNVLDNVMEMGVLLGTELRENLSSMPYVGNVRGRGLFWAVEFMADPEMMQPFKPADNFSNRIVEAARNIGLNVLGNIGETGEYYVDLVIISPPYIINAAEVREVVRLLKEAVAGVSQEYDSALLTDVSRHGDMPRSNANSYIQRSTL